MEQIRLLLVDDEPSVRRGLRMRLALEPDLDVVGEAENGVEAIQLSTELEPAVVVMDVTMPVMDGIQATEEIRSRTGAAVVVLSMHDDEATADRAFAAGAADFVAKHRMDDGLLTAIRRAAGGKRGCV
jgi:DNA-binding NarL/FixJ family response regulator